MVKSAAAANAATAERKDGKDGLGKNKKHDSVLELTADGDAKHAMKKSDHANIVDIVIDEPDCSPHQKPQEWKSSMTSMGFESTRETTAAR